MTDLLDTAEERAIAAEVASLEARLAGLRSRLPYVSVREPMTYRRDGQREGGSTPYGYFSDVARRHVDPSAAARLDRHTTEMRVWLEERNARALRTLDEARDQRDTFGLSYRVNPNPTTGQGGYLDPPAWLIEDAAIFPRPKRVLAKQVNRFELPLGVSSINIPVMTAGNTVGIQVPNQAAQSSDVQDAATSCNAVTFAGIGDISMQLRDMSPTAGADHAWFADLTSAYDFALEQQLYVGTGGTGLNAQVLGLLNVPDKSATIYTDGSPTGKAMYPYFGQVAAHIGNNRGMPPYAWLMRTARWGWLTTSEDSSLRPLEFPTLNGPDPACPGAISGWPAWMADALPQNFTTTSTTIASSSNNAAVSSGTYNVTSTTGFTPSGSFQTQTSTGWATIAYTGTTSTTFTGCTVTAGTGTLSTSTGSNIVYQITQGATTNQDVVIACIPQDIYLFEGTPVLSTFDEPLSGSLGVRFQFRNYAAAITGRYATGISFLGGSGMTVQAGFAN